MGLSAGHPIPAFAGAAFSRKLGKGDELRALSPQSSVILMIHKALVMAE